MGIAGIDDDLHDQLRRACTVTSRSINAQANFWIEIGMLCEMHPELSFQRATGSCRRSSSTRWR